MNVPSYQIARRRFRDGVLFTAHATGEDIEDTVKAVAAYIKLGYKAIRRRGYLDWRAPTALAAAKCTMSQRKRRAPGKRLELRTLHEFCSAII